MLEMTRKEKTAYEWALKRSSDQGALSCRIARILADYIDRNIEVELTSTIYQVIKADPGLTAMEQGRCSDWTCTKCGWTGDYSSTVGVMYHGTDWQHCPSCNSVAIPATGST
jgi:hypothetical protein